MSDDFLKLEAVAKSFQSGKGKTLEVLKEIDLIVNKGSFIAIIGRSGAGKSTLLNLIGGLDKPTSGTIHYNNIDITRLDDNAISRFRNRTIGFIFQFHYLLPEFSALENVSIPLLIRKIGLKKSRIIAKKFLTEVGLENRMTHKPSELSGGECQRVAVARALVSDPDIVLVDEPTGNLDKENSQMVQDILINLNKKYNKTFIMVTHDLNFADTCDIIYKLDDGKIMRSKNKTKISK